MSVKYGDRVIHQKANESSLLEKTTSKLVYGAVLNIAHGGKPTMVRSTSEVRLT